MIVQFSCADQKVAELLDTIQSFGISRLNLFRPASVPESPKQQAEFEKLAQKIAAHVAPRDNRPMRKEVLQLALGGGDTFHDLMGDADPALRNGTGALSKALRRFAPYEESPLDILCTRRREVFGSGPAKGLYQGTRYIPTKLGKRVHEILKQKGLI